MQTHLVVLEIARTTLLDTGTVARAMAHAIADASGDVVTRESVDRSIGLPTMDALEALLAEARGGDPDLDDVRRIHGELQDDLVRHYATAPEVAPVPGAARCFSELRSRGVRIALGTSFDRRIADAALRRLGWRVGRDVDAVVTSDEVARGRPHSDTIERAMRLTGVTDTAAVVKVGDTPIDVMEGRAARASLVVGVTTGAHDRVRLLAAGATHVIASVAELVPLLTSLRALPSGRDARAVA